MKAHILVVEDDPLLCKMLNFLLTDADYHVDLLTDPRLVLPFLTDHVIDLTLLDVALPFVDGFAVAMSLRSAFPKLPVIFVTARASLDDKLRGLDVGEDYLTKPFEPAELLARIDKVLQRSHQRAQHETSAQIMVENTMLDLTSLQFHGGEHGPALLTPTEMRLLEHLMRHAGQVVSRKALIEAAWESDFAGFGNRLDVYIRRLRHKIEEIPEEPEFVHTVRGSGYVFRAGAGGEIQEQSLRREREAS